MLNGRLQWALLAILSLLLCIITIVASTEVDVSFLDTRTNRSDTELFYYDIGKEVAYFQMRTEAGDHRLRNGKTFAPKYIIFNPTSSVAAAQVLLQLEAALLFEKTEYLALLGPTGNGILRPVIRRTRFFRREHFVCFAPTDTTDEMRSFRNRVFFTTADAFSNLMAMLSLMTESMGIRRVALFYIDNEGSKDAVIKAVHDHLLGAECSPPIVYSGDSSNNTIDSTALSEVLSTQPQLIILFAVECNHTSALFRELVTTLKDVTVVALSRLRNTLSHEYTQYRRSGIATLPPSFLYFTTSYPFVSYNPSLQDRFQLIMRMFRDNFEVYTALGLHKKYCKENGVIGDCSINKDMDYIMEAVAAGYIDARTLLEAINTFSGSGLSNITAKEFQRYLFDYQLFRLDDGIGLGPYVDECRPTSHNSGYSCSCNQGAHHIMITSMDSVTKDHQYFKNVPGSDFFISVEDCYSDKVVLRTAVVMVAVAIEHDEMSIYMIVNYFGGVMHASSALEEISQRRYLGYPLFASSDSTQRALGALVDDYMATVLIGPVDPNIIYDYGLVLVDPIYTEVDLHRTEKNHIYISTTLEQEMAVIASYLGGVKSRNAIPPPVMDNEMHAIMRAGKRFELITETLEYTLLRYNMKLGIKTNVRDGEDILSRLPTEGITYMIGIQRLEIYDLAHYLESNPNSMVIVPFDEVTMHYDVFERAFSSLTYTAATRLLFATSLPHWKNTTGTCGRVSKVIHDTREDSPFSTQNCSMTEMQLQFLQLYPREYEHNPAAFRSFLVIQVLNRVIGSHTRVTTSTLPEMLYALRQFTINDMEFGVYETHCEDGELVCENMKYINYGARQIAVWPFTRALDPMFPVYALGSSQGEDPLDKHKKSPLPQWVFILLCFLGGLLGFVFVTLLLLCCCGGLTCGKGDARDNRNAPKDKDVPVTLVFTDIESSTALWALTPDAMKDAVEAHHKIIRALIIKHKCYEVKTIGDSFMIACGNAFSAVQLARDLQVKFLSGDTYDVLRIDAAYAEIREGNDSFLTRESSGQFSNDAVWRGLRVRVGIHTGEADIQYDTVTKGYDYYGDTANIAARAESVCAGGQVVMTESTYKALARSKRDALLVTALGPLTLRGVPFPVEMYQLDCVAGRVYPALKNFSMDETWLPGSARGKKLLSRSRTDSGSYMGRECD